MLRGARAWSALLAVGVGLGCQPRLPDVDAFGARVAIGTEADVELCAGTLKSFDEHVLFVEEELGITRPPDNTLEVFIVEDATVWCKEVEACYIGGWVDATFVPTSAAQSVWHELVHQVVAGSDIGMTDRFLSEGLASALGDDWCPTSPGGDWPATPLLDLLGKADVAFEDYPRGASFIDFVRERYGTDALVELVGCVHRGDPISTVEACFERALQHNIAQVGREFEADAPAHHPNPALCRGPVERWSGTGEAWTRDVALGCDQSTTVNTFTGPHAREVDVLLEVPRAGWYELFVLGDGDAHVELKPCFCAGQNAGVHAEAGDETIWVEEAGTHRVVVTTEDPSATRARIVMAPSTRKWSPPA